MRVFRTVSSYRLFLEEFQNNHFPSKIGFVPTMGYLHEGHLSLIRQSKKEADLTVCSIFVNPLQFNNKEDLEKYPRDEKRDLELLEKEKCDVVFIPPYEEMYPVSPTREYRFPGLDDLLEGEFRPGHFNGVATVVARLFDIISPNIAYFGKKDYQQYLIVRELAKNEYPHVLIKPMPIIREHDGLAMSSRNVRLSPEARKEAVLLYQTLLLAKAMIKKKNIEQVIEICVDKITSNSHFKLEYFTIVNAENLKPVKDQKKEPLIALVAAWIDNVRLIDNMEI
ncbi:MAG: pantoate--beta-alanine ligase [Bacteroidales bacterium]|nr:pantoate--beta-alanine ligase [Bacteroidales bacterium]